MTALPTPPKPLAEMTNGELAEHWQRSFWMTKGFGYDSGLDGDDRPRIAILTAVLDARDAERAQAPAVTETRIDALEIALADGLARTDDTNLRHTGRIALARLRGGR